MGLFKVFSAFIEQGWFSDYTIACASFPGSQLINCVGEEESLVMDACGSLPRVWVNYILICAPPPQERALN